MTLDDLITSRHDWLVSLRRHFHRYPELAYHEHRTVAKIFEVLESFQIPHTKGIGRTGIVARLKAANPGPTVAFRCDMDALPIEEAVGAPYRSEHPGVMHACGHDAHMTIALGIIRALVESDWRSEGAGELLFIFQPAEEGGAGARAMLESGFFDGMPVRAIFAGHLYPQLATATIGIAHGVCNASSDSFSIRITGKGGHGAYPHLCKDPIVLGAQLLTSIQSLISRETAPMDSAVITVGRFQAGSATNIIPEQALLEGTLRALDPATRNRLIDRLKALATSTAEAAEMQAAVEIAEGYPVLANNLELSDFAERIGQQLLGEAAVHRQLPRMGSEDFSFFANRWPGVLIGLGCRTPESETQSNLHSPHFEMDERVLDIGVQLFAKLLTETCRQP